MLGVWFCATTVSAQNLLTNPSFEQGLSGWEANGTNSILAASPAHSGSSAGLATNRTADAQGVRQSLLGKLRPGASYVGSAWARVDGAAPQPVRLSFQQQDDGGTRSFSVAEGVCSNGVWVYLAGVFSLNTTGTLQRLDVVLDGPAAGVALRVDDVAVVPLSGLRLATAQSPVWFGGVGGDTTLRNDPAYAAVVRTDYHIAGPENALKFSGTESRSNTFSFTAGNIIVNSAMTNGQNARGHTLVWHSAVPAWIETNTWTTGQLQTILYNHIDVVAAQFKGRVFCWDVVNEAFNDNGTLRSTLWYDQPGIGFAGQGTKYLEEIFKRARAADPTCRLIYNDYSAETDNAKSDAIYAMAQDFLARGVPLDGIGFQFHLSGTPSLSSMRANFQRFNDLGLDLHITELDARVPVDSNGVASAASLASQGDTYFNVVGTALAFPRTKVIQTWGFTDRYSWIPAFSPGNGAALPLDEDYNRKPAWWGMFNALANQAEGLEVAAVSAGDAHTVLTITAFSAGRARRLLANAANDFFTLTANVPYTGEYNLRVGVRKGAAAGRFQLASAPVAVGAFTNLGAAQDLYASSTSYNELNLGSFNFAETGEHFFRFTVTGKNASSTGYELVVDYLRLTPTGADGNQPPAISPLADQTIYEGQGSGPLPFTLSDRETVEAALAVTASSSNPALVPNTNLIFSGGGPQRLLVATPAAGQSGTTLVTLTVTDAASNSVSESFTMTVLPLTTTLISTGSVWKYFDKTNDLGTAWRMSGYSDAGWSNGPAQLGFGDGDEATAMVSNGLRTTTYFRRPFTVSTNAVFHDLTARILRDDGAVAYLNGVEIFRSNMPTNQVITWSTKALTNASGGDETSNFYNYPLPLGLLLPGTNVVAVEVHQYGTTSSDLSFDFALIATNVTPQNNTLPTISPIADQTTDEDRPLLLLPFTVGDAQSSASLLAVSASSSNPALLPQANIVLSGSGSNRFVSLTPAPDQSGPVSVTLTVADGFGSVSASFLLTVTPVNDLPAITWLAPAHQTVLGAGPVTLTVSASDPENALARVEYFLDGGRWGESAIPPYSLVVTNLPGGYHTLFAQAVDAGGGTAKSSNIFLTVNWPLLPLVSNGSDWKYHDLGQNLGTHWRRADFDDSAWFSGPAPLGYGDANGLYPRTTNSFGSVTNNKYITTYYRRAFVVPDVPAWSNATLSLQRDDGVVVYLNGLEVFRSNLPTGAVSHLTLASSAVTGAAETNWYSTNLNGAMLLPGTNFLAVEVHQNTNTSSDIWFDLRLGAQPMLGGPRLVFEFDGPAVQLRWPAWAVGLSPWVAENLSVPVNWQPVSTHVLVVTNGECRLPLVPASATTFYRLQSP